MPKKLSIILTISFIFTLMVTACSSPAKTTLPQNGNNNGTVPETIKEDSTLPTTSGTALTESEAKAIAEANCIKGGESISSGSYNPNSKTWWFDANLNATKEGCNPACVVSEETKTVEINWRCTGLINPDKTSE